MGELEWEISRESLQTCKRKQPTCALWSAYTGCQLSSWLGWSMP